MKRSVTYTGVVARTLGAHERRVSTSESATPLVIEPQQARDVAFLETFLAAYSTDILDEIASNGAVLLRGFDVTSPRDFERAVLGIQGMRGMNEVLMSEEGRTVVEGTTHVLYTNTKYKTGGTFDAANFHTENYFVPDVPRYIAFCCLTPSWLGGETGLVNTAKLYADLPARLQESLAARTVTAREYRLADVAARYALTLGQVREFCERVGLPIVTRDGVEQVAIYKPSVIEHPVTHERALVVNFGGPLAGVGIAPRLNAAFAGDYVGLHWAMHRLHWKRPSVTQTAALLGGLVTRPRDAWPYLGFRLRAMFRPPAPPPPRRAADDATRLGDLFADGHDVEVMAQAMRRRFSSFTWKPGDVLILDNLKMAHAGMPGFGPRNLKALICNCLALPVSQGPGLFAPGRDDERECFGAQLTSVPSRTAAEAPLIAGRAHS